MLLPWRERARRCLLSGQECAVFPLVGAVCVGDRCSVDMSYITYGEAMDLGPWLVHNHPSGDTWPSVADLKTAAGLKLLRLDVVDPSTYTVLSYIVPHHEAWARMLPVLVAWKETGRKSTFKEYLNRFPANYGRAYRSPVKRHPLWSQI